MKTLAVSLALLFGLFVARTADATTPVTLPNASTSAGFEVFSISVPDNSIWQINRPIDIVFNQDVDFATVNLNTIQIRKTNGQPASGTFSLTDPRTVRFQPSCPTNPDFSDAGLQPGGVRYSIFLPGGGAGPSVHSLAAFELTRARTVHFVTPASLVPSILFLDTAVGPASPVIQTSPGQIDACYVEIGQNPSQRVYFAPLAVPDRELGAGTPAGFRAPLNLHSDVRSRVAILIQLDQSVNPLPQNVSPANVRLEYQTGPGLWTSLPHQVELVANCIPSGAIVRVTPIGILPQGKLVRAALSTQFQDLVGQTHLLPVTVGSFLVTTSVDPGTTTPGDDGDELLEEFVVGAPAPGSFEDGATPLAETRAIWNGGMLTASFGAFTGSGGPGGDFDWQIGNDLPAAQPPVILDTTFSIITNTQQTAQQAVINGQVDVRNFTVKANGTLILQGPNPCRIQASGAVQIDGKIQLRGGNNPGVASFNTTNTPEPGAPGQVGGGRGGTGNPLTTQSSPMGGPGFGAFNAPGGGGGGGESGYNPDVNGNFRRAAGGGGGALGTDALIPNGVTPNTGPYVNVNLCPNQTVIGLDVEQGFPGAPQASGALHPGVQPVGGAKGPRPFTDGDATNDFWGTMKTQTGGIVQGELLAPSAGAGGGGGGNSIQSSSFPLNPFSPTGDEKGSGGGGGGGALTILSLGDIVFGVAGRIDASGGTGGPGESGFGPQNPIGGGSGGGSGGHVVLQTASRINLQACRSTTNPPGGIYALGAQGGAGRDLRGGAVYGGFQTSPNLDALPPNSYPSTVASTPCRVFSGQSGYTFTNNIGDFDPANVVIGAGGDGGPGIIQLHAPTLADILTPTTAGESIYKIIRPPPIGAFPQDGVPNLSTINNPLAWDQTLPLYGRRSQGLSKWIGLGAASVDPTSPVPDPVEFSFAGTGSLGEVSTQGSGSGATVPELPPIFTGTLSSAPVPPYVTADGRTLVIDGTLLPDDIYLRAPALLRRFVLQMTRGTTTAFDVRSAGYDASAHELRLTVTASGMPLAGYAAGDLIVLRPRFFRVLTDGVPDSLPDTARIQMEFQATTPNFAGGPDLGAASAWTHDLVSLDPNVGGNPDFRFVRFRVSFDVAANGAPLTPATPIPSLDFLRIPFRF